MRDYAELVEALRECAIDGCNKCPYSWMEIGCRRQTQNDAADAIEDLVVALTASNEVIAKSRDKWISVEERLPDGGVHVLACCRAKWLAGSENLYVCDAFHSNPKTIVCSYDDDIDSEYDEETDEYYFPEGWWEVIKNWDDYSCVAIEDVVTHWMPLPEPPKEDDNG